MRKKLFLVLSTVAIAVMILAGCESKSPRSSTIMLSVLVDQNWLETYGLALQAVSDAALEKYNIKIELENKANGSEGDNTVKTRLAAGEMTDLLIFNSGAQLMSLNPSEYFVDLTDIDIMGKVDENFKKAVEVAGKQYGIPVNSSFVGGFVYNKKVYDKLGLKIPATWDEFMSNLKVCKEEGYDAVLGTCKDPWSAQYIVLADNYNVEAAYPGFAKDFESGRAKVASTEAALRSWEKLSDVGQYLNSDYMATTVIDGMDLMGEDGGPVHWAMTSQFFSYIDAMGYNPDDYGMFPIPSDEAYVNGYTVWMPNGMYVNKNSKNVDAALTFLNFYVSDEGMNIFKENAAADGPYLIKGVELPSDSYQGILDLQPYFNEGKTGLALEFETQLKGANCDQISVECISGSMNGKEAAEAYDEDCKKMAVQLGLEGW
ncbi:MAG: extracellular solute-binding protein [Flavobacteriaceae bacterium]|jgi:raffinose/stachyose/melibiose transport system substrate-binding protein|nr:extracellular solute-binding protein [Flavobacteriaceae bacterium]